LGLFGVLVVLGLIVAYWEIALAIAGGAAILFVLVRYAGDGDKTPNWSAAGGWTAAIVAVVAGAIVLGNGEDKDRGRSGQRAGNLEAGSAGLGGDGDGGHELEGSSSGSGALTDAHSGTGDFPTDRVRRVIDGDTVETEQLGDVRLIGVDTPEEGKCHDNAATQFTRARLEGEVVGVEFDQERTDRYGRTLAYLYRGGMHNLALLEEGHAEVLTVPPNDRYEQDFERAEQDAKSSGGGEGLWSACDEPTPTPSPSGGDEDDDSAAAAPDPAPAAPSGDINCSAVSGPIPTPPGDPNNLDGDGDGLACE